eukprot:TRINITY_DN62935_c0_g2_i1.p1 TRINITY_DN62935_c0_g2~~TRINITY_DN62935_c0_g2_i1.p1  ORF type:complete len:446 (+),score=57.99 TRINITY_DN62935_c0_g2_i1:119-1456(+)
MAARLWVLAALATFLLQRVVGSPAQAATGIVRRQRLLYRADDAAHATQPDKSNTEVTAFGAVRVLSSETPNLDARSKMNNSTEETGHLHTALLHQQPSMPGAEATDPGNAKSIFITGPEFQPMVRFAGHMVPNCSSKCRIERNISAFPRADAVVWNFINDNSLVMKVPAQKPPSQRWIFTQFYEPQIWDEKHMCEAQIAQINEKTDYTMTFAPGSDIQSSYFMKVPLDDKQVTPPRVNMALNKSKLVYWAMSDCKSDRMNFSKKLHNLLPNERTDMYGKCATPHPCPPRLKKDGPECAKQVRAAYKFVAAFENNRCRGYITEKPWEALLSGAVPVVVGGTSRKDYENALPEGSFIYVEDFSSHQQLVDYLLKLDSDDAEYNKYHEWRYKYRIATEDESAAQSYCKLCERLHQEDNSSSSVLQTAHIRLSAWWFDNACRTGYPELN